MKERVLIANLLNCKNQRHHKGSVKEVSTTSNVKAEAHTYKLWKNRNDKHRIQYNVTSGRKQWLDR